jgi:murein DD-endopeptidase MepM/ murein hydrolase activator NlpD
MRFSTNPFSNPFGSSRVQRTAYANPEPAAYPTARVRVEPLSPVATVPASRPIAAQPLPPVGSVSSLTDSPPPARAFAYNEPTEPAVTGALNGASPKVGGFKAGGWTATGGAVIAARAGETVNTLSNRYGVPAEAILRVNGLTSPALTPGQQITIPVYNANKPGAAVAPQNSLAPENAVQPVVVKTKRVSTLTPFEEAPPASHERPMVGVAQLKPVATGEPERTGSIPVTAKPKAKIVRQAGGIHVVRPGETLTAIALSYGTTRPKLAAANGIDEWMSVKIGQQLRVPAGAATAQAQPQPQPQPLKPRPVAQPSLLERLLPPRTVPTEVASEPVQPKPAKPVTVATVQPKPGKPLATRALTQAKPLAPATAPLVQAKPVLQTAAVEPKHPKPLKPATQLAATTSPKPVKPAEVAIAKPKTVPAARPVAVAQVKPVKPVPVPQATASIPAEKPVAAAQPAPLEAAKPGAPEFRWPVKGRIIQDFGQNSDGINISVPEGTEIKAAENGVVAYAGNELKGYGNLILIRHADGYVTAYAHARDLSVKRGDTVRRGQTIATAGQTGNVTSPQLLFEVRKGATPVNPRQFLSGT